MLSFCHFEVSSARGDEEFCRRQLSMISDHYFRRVDRTAAAVLMDSKDMR